MENTEKNFTINVGFEGDFETRSDLYDELKIDLALDKLQPQLGWMKNLKSLAIISVFSYDRFYHHHSYTIQKLLMFLMKIQKESRSLEKLFISRDLSYDFNDCLAWFMAGPSVKSFALLNSYFLRGNPLTVGLLNHERFRELEQLAHITFSHRLEYLTELTYVHGRCGDNIQVLLYKIFFYLMIYNDLTDFNVLIRV